MVGLWHLSPYSKMVELWAGAEVRVWFDMQLTAISVNCYFPKDNLGRLHLAENWGWFWGVLKIYRGTTFHIHSDIVSSFLLTRGSFWKTAFYLNSSVFQANFQIAEQIKKQQQQQQPPAQQKLTCQVEHWINKIKKIRKALRKYTTFKTTMLKIGLIINTRWSL